MAYDPNDPADKKIVKGLIDEALAALTAEHETDIAGLKSKNIELLAKLKEASKGENNAAEVARLETELEKVQTQLKDSVKLQKSAEKQNIELQKSLETESGTVRTLLVDNGLTEALTKANVPAQFMPAVKSLLSSKVELKTEGETRVAKVGDKSLGEFITEWSQGDEGKHFIGAPNNSGTGAPGNKVPGANTSQTLTRAAFEALAPAAKMEFSTKGGTLTD